MSSAQDFNERGSSETYQALMHQNSGSGLRLSAVILSNRDFIPTAAVSNSAGYTVLAFRTTEPLVPDRVVQHTQASGSRLRGQVASWAAAGSFVNAMVTNSAGYTIFGIDPLD